MSNKLSYSKVSSYNLCGERYRLSYVEGLQAKQARASLSFGGAFDKAGNVLLETRDLAKALVEFDKQWNFQWVNGKYIGLKSYADIVYADADFDADLVTLTEEQEAWIKQFKIDKKSKKWFEIDEEARSKYNSFCWESLRAKGVIMLTSYHDKVLPKLYDIKAIQYKHEVTNDSGDTIVQYLDFVATTAEHSVIIFDNKTTSSLDYYEDDSAANSPQLISYYYTTKDLFKLDGVGFIAISKQIIKNKTKTCPSCGFNGNESKARTCDNEIQGTVVKRGKESPGLVRCGAEWEVTMNPEAAVKIIVNSVSDKAADLVMDSFDVANKAIKAGIYPKNLSACKNIFGAPCEFQKVCWAGDKSEVVPKPERKE